tara:strand:- start:3876 stop:4787 length:912 start_codon:yes stop_codon:yes gene_type:complete
MSVKIGNKYKVLKKIGEGAFGTVYKGVIKGTDNIVAIKIESKESKTINRLKHESLVYEYLRDAVGFPTVYEFLERKHDYVFIMEFLGPNLEELFKFCDRKFSLKTVLMISIQILNRIEKLHNRGFIHRDIKPDNFLIGVNDKKKGRVFIIDFGLSKKYITKTKTHIPYNDNKHFTGSYRYCSIRNHKGIEQSRRDDLESIGYMLIYFLTKKLPWQGLGGSNKNTKKKKIFGVKKNISLEQLCKGIPKEFLLYMKHCRLLKFTDKPNYKLLKKLFITLFKKKNYSLDFVYDWNIIARRKKRLQK